MECVPNTGDGALDEAIQNWLKLDKNVKTRNDILQLCKEKKYDALRKYLLKRMEFGTAGLRAEMGSGNARMNDLTIIQTTQGFCQYLFQQFGEELKSRGVIIGYDSRHNSTRFANLAANCFILSGVKVFLYSSIVPTPFVPYGVVKYKTCAGIMVTASHNPKQDNGYKVYWDNGAQIIPPHDSGISSSILENLIPLSDELWEENACKSAYDPYNEVMETYYADLAKYSNYRELNENTRLRFTYTPVHGVGQKFAKQAFKTFGLPMFEDVPEQMNPDPEFSTVKYPNPEEGKGVLLLSMRTADQTGCSVILANDPDADRLAVAEKLEDGSWTVFTGNELGALFGWWAWHSHVTRNPDKTSHSDVYMLSSTVSSVILKSIARVEGFSFEDTLTGFKWMGNRADQLSKDGKTVLYAFEEAIGFMYGTNVLDKDGISGLAVMAECACYLASNGLTLHQQLQKIYEKYGDHVSNNSYYISHDADKTGAMFHRLRHYPGDDVITNAASGDRYPKRAGRFEVEALRDLTTGFDSRTEDGKALLPSSASSQMITFYFTNQVVLTIRTSGTEPKIKYYSEICGKVGVARTELRSELDELVATICEEFYQPEKNGFMSRPT